MKGIMRFGKKGKLVPRYIRPFPIFKRVRKVAYQSDLLEDLKEIHSVFHVLLLKRYILDESHVLKSELVQIDPKLSYEERPIVIGNRQV